MNNQPLLKIILAGAVVFIASSLSAQLVVTLPSQSTTIDFQTNLGYTPGSDVSGDDVFKAGPGNQRYLLENASTSWTGNSDFGLSSDAWSWYGGGLNTGMGSGVRSQFGDYNNDGDFGDNLGSLNAVAYSDRGTLGIGASGDMAYDIGNTAAPWRDYSLTLRVLNNSGVAISDWSMALDTWYQDDASAPYAVTISYSTDNSNFTAIDSYTTSNTSAALIALPLSGAFTASVANGESLYLQLSTIRPSGSNGARVVADNWNVTAVPEPSTYALIGGLAILGLVMLRRRR